MAVKRKRIGVLIGSANAEHMRKILNGMYHAVEDYGIDLVVFAGSQMQLHFMDGSDIDNDYMYMNYVNRLQVRQNNIDGMIICYGSHGIYMNDAEKSNLLDQFADIPYILMEEFSDKEETSYIINDNYNGMRKVVEHLTDYHGYTKFLYVGGIEGNREAIERQRAFEDVLNERNIPFNESMMVNGQFSERCEEQIRQLFDRNEFPEAVVCASDLMAMGECGFRKKDRNKARQRRAVQAAGRGGQDLFL